MSFFIFNILLAITITISCYLLGLFLFKKYKKSWLNPLYTASVMVVILLLFTPIKGESYQEGIELFSLLL
ncbi:hypothetical protein GCM10007111_35420 [Virgibacillus kapii]|uniref:LrgB-like family protein n=2 Tax=Virgibacillus TaxID=84406 RepID=A0A024QF06_9BACI|nr:hypothetical protein M948_17740 [Virgibacillus sp. CM-4]GGJ70758.1 hypothetical protein GCM10007111_35420 [Virgibacillus kapii]CDQ40832.1 LrgB-like family protein [Virgibacillus massiliensis]